MNQDALLETLKTQGISNQRLLKAMRDVPRERFVGTADRDLAYENRALPIESGQTISQPYIVARMTQALMNQPRGRVLEVGTGSGYQAAILSELFEAVYSIERIETLYHLAKQRLSDIHANNVQVKHGDGLLGWPEAAPFDGIIVTAAPAELPQELPAQLQDGGRLVIPIGPQGDQTLYAIDRKGDTFTRTALDAVRFVPLLPGVK